MNVENTISFLEEKTRTLVTFLYGWITTEGEPLGYILGVIHVTFCISLAFMIIISHTLYPALWLQCILFIIFFAIWLQHIFLKVCVFFITEENLTKTIPPFYMFIKFLTNLDQKDWVVPFMAGESVAILCFFLSLCSQFSLMLYKFYNIEM